MHEKPLKNTFSQKLRNEPVLSRNTLSRDQVVTHCHFVCQDVGLIPTGAFHLFSKKQATVANFCQFGHKTDPMRNLFASIVFLIVVMRD